MQEVSSLDTPLGTYLVALMKDPENEKLLGAEPLVEFIDRRLQGYQDEYDSVYKETKSPSIAHEKAMVVMTAGLVEDFKVPNDYDSNEEESIDTDKEEE